MRSAAQEARDREEHDRADEVTLAPEELAEPAGEWDDDDAGEDVAGRDPRDLVEARAEIPHHVGERDVDDRAVDDLHQRREHDGERDQVFVLRALGGRGYRLGERLAVVAAPCSEYVGRVIGSGDQMQAAYPTDTTRSGLCSSRIDSSTVGGRWPNPRC